jgi:tartrate dehydratase beta subunit/fumarate hydratase class I family protein
VISLDASVDFSSISKAWRELVADGTDLATAILDVSVQSQRGLKARRNVYGGIVDSAATLARSASPRTRRWSTIAHDRTSRGKSHQAICKRMNKLRMSPVDCQRTVIYVGGVAILAVGLT